MIKVCCFDLDGTLLQMDGEGFLEDYMKTLAGELAQYIEPKEFIRKLWASTEEMIRNTDAAETNQSVFEKHFLAATGIERDKLWPKIDYFYQKMFAQFEKHAHKSNLSREIVEAAIARGYKIVLATNPVFPEEAIRERMRWAGVEELPFDLITTYENSHYCKPQPNYFLEIAGKIGVEPSDCIMIGNDRQEDLIAGQIGMKTFLVLNQVNEKGENHYTADEEGTLAELLVAIRDRSGIFED